MFGVVEAVCRQCLTALGLGYPPFMRRGILGTFILIWLLVGVFAAWQRDYFNTGSATCAEAGNIALTVLAGPLNYAGVNPKVDECRLPAPSSMSSFVNTEMRSR